MRQAENERKKIQTRIPFMLDPAKKILKNYKKNQENQKTRLRHYFQPKWDEIDRETDKKLLDLNSVHTRPVEGNSEKKKAKKYKKLKKPFPGLFLAETG